MTPVRRPPIPPGTAASRTRPAVHHPVRSAAAASSRVWPAILLAAVAGCALPGSDAGRVDLLGRRHPATAEEEQARAEASLTPQQRSANLVRSGRAKLARGDREGAFRDLQRAVELDPMSKEARLSRGQMLLERGDAAGAGKDFDEVLAASPAHGPALQGRGAARMAQGDFDGAGADLDAARQSSGDTVELCDQRAKLFQLQAVRAEGRRDPGERDRLLNLAVAEYTRALRIAPDRGDLLEKRGAVRVKLADPRARADLQKALAATRHRNDQARIEELLAELRIRLAEREGLVK